ncbi:MAG: 2-hydroxyacyl-CoA dehydratase family protein [Defluviitaleaceae bacterium]|nr:2-hydroxyacyl-CoA dehydratase family protein [Defluviitaleaceae bacterium]
MYKNEFMQRLNLGGALTSHMALDAARMIVVHQTRVYTDAIWNGKERIVWTNMVMPTELFYAAGLIPVHTELTAGWMSTLGLAGRYCDIAERNGYNVNLCSYHKTVIGAMERGDIPAPEIAVFSSHICDGGAGLIKYMEKRFNTKVMLVAVPYFKTKQSFEDLRRQLEQVRWMLAQHTGTDITSSGMSAAAVLSNEARRHLKRANAAREGNVLINGNDVIRNLFGMTFLLGSEIGAEAAKSYAEQLAGMKSDNAVRKRILWIHFAPLYAGDIMRYFENDLECKIVFDITGHIYWDGMDENDLLGSMADKILSHFYLGSASRRISLYTDIIRRYRIDGVVMFMHQGCRAIAGSSFEIRRLCRDLSVPFLEVPGDCIDSRQFSSEQMKLRMEAFSENLEWKANVSGY